MLKAYLLCKVSPVGKVLNTLTVSSADGKDPPKKKEGLYTCDCEALILKMQGSLEYSCTLLLGPL